MNIIDNNIIINDIGKLIENKTLWNFESISKGINNNPKVVKRITKIEEINILISICNALNLLKQTKIDSI